MNNYKVDFKLSMEFSGEFPESKVKELMFKVANALYREYHSGEGFAPIDEDDCLTEGVKIKYKDIHLVDTYYSNANGKIGVRNTNVIDFTGKDS